MYSSNSQCDRQRGIFALSKTFFRRNTDVFQEKMVQRSVKRPAVRVRWEFSDTPYKIGFICDLRTLRSSGDSGRWRRYRRGSDASSAFRLHLATVVVGLLCYSALPAVCQLFFHSYIAHNAGRGHILKFVHVSIFTLVRYHGKVLPC